MTFQPMPAFHHWPMWDWRNSANLNMSALVIISAADRRGAMVFRNRYSASPIRRCHVGIDDSTLSWPVNGVRFRLIPIDLTVNGGLPIEGMDHAFGDYTGAAPNVPGRVTTPDLTDDGTPTGNFYTAAVGEFVGLHMETLNFQAGDHWVPGVYTMLSGFHGSEGSVKPFSNSGFGWGDANNLPAIIVEYVDGHIDRFGLPTWIDSNLVSLAPPAEIGNVIVPAIPVRAVAIYASFDGFGDKVDLNTQARLYGPNGGSPLAIGSANRVMMDRTGSVFFFDDGSAVELDAGIAYRAVIGGGTQSIDNVEYEDRAFLDLEHAEAGGSIYRTERADEAVEGFTDTFTERMQVGLIIDAIDPVKTRSARIYRLAGVRNIVHRLEGARR